MFKTKQTWGQAPARLYLDGRGGGILQPKTAARASTNSRGASAEGESFGAASERRPVGCGPTMVRPIAGDVLLSPGQPLDEATRAYFEPRLGHDFSQVRVHADGNAAASARMLHASAYTAGLDLVFGAGRYRPGTAEGRRLLAHELTHVVQQASNTSPAKAISSTGDAGEQEAERVASIISGGQGVSVRPVGDTALLQRQGDLTLDVPTFGRQKPPHSLFPPGQEPHLHLEPWIQVYSLLDPDVIIRALLAMDLSSLTAPPPPGLQIPTPPPATHAPVVPRGAGPDTPRAASAGDVLAALAAVPAVRTEITRLRDTASDQLRHDWRSLSTGDKVVAVGATALVAGGALAGILANDSSRQFALHQIQGRNIPVPMVPGLSLQVNPIGPNQSVMLNLDLSALARKLGM